MSVLASWFVRHSIYPPSIPRTTLLSNEHCQSGASKLSSSSLRSTVQASPRQRQRQPPHHITSQAPAYIPTTPSLTVRVGGVCVCRQLALDSFHPSTQHNILAGPVSKHHCSKMPRSGYDISGFGAAFSVRRPEGEVRVEEQKGGEGEGGGKGKGKAKQTKRWGAVSG